MALLVGQGPGKGKTGRLEVRKSEEELHGWTYSSGRWVS